MYQCAVPTPNAQVQALSYCVQENDKKEAKVKSLIKHRLFPDNIKYLKRNGLWPPEFQDPPPAGARCSL